MQTHNVRRYANMYKNTQHTHTHKLTYTHINLYKQINKRMCENMHVSELRFKKETNFFGLC